MLPLPVVAIVGRPNVGKSSLLNALVGKRIAIVQDMPGVTRDRVSIPLQLRGHYVEMVDTGGYGFEDPDQLTLHIKHQIEMAMARSNLVVFIVDCDAGLTSADIEIATLLRKQGLNTLLVANKADGPKADAALGDFARLGLGTPLGVSALTNRNLDALAEAIADRIDLSNAPTEIPPPEMMVAIVGKRNAGKSTLVNTIAEIYDGHGDRVIVSEVPGTTRDSIDVRFEKDGKGLVVIDTAGVRKKRHMVTNDIEFYSFHRAQRSVRRSDVVLLLIDATETISDPDKKLAAYVAEQYKPVVIIVNKWDLALKALREQSPEEGEKPVDDSTLMARFHEYLTAELKHLSFAPIAFVTATEGRNVQPVLDLCQHLFNQANQRLTTGRLNRAVRQVLTEKIPSTPSGRKAKIFYATQTDVAPPTIVLFVNKPEYVEETYQRFMINRLRDLLPYAEVPIRLYIRARGEAARGAPALDELGEADLEETVEKVTKRKLPERPRKKSKTYRAPPAAPGSADRRERQKSKPRPKSLKHKGVGRGSRPGR